MEPRDAALLVISNVIVHDVPKHKKNETTAQIDYSERESDLSDDLKLFFKDKVTQAVSTKGFKVVFDSDTASPVPLLIRNMMDGKPAPFVDSSKEISKHLFDIQTGWNPAGIIVIIKGLVDRKRVVVVMKLERDEGARLKKNSRQHFIDIESVRDLMLTKKTKLYKVGFFFNRDDFNTDFDGYVCDNQISIESTAGVAKFFLEQYLGCRLYDDTRKLTRNFFESTKEFILRVEDPIKRATYYEHLLSYLNRQARTIDPREFSMDYLDPEYRQDYEDHLQRLNVQLSSFEKDNDLVKAHITKMMIDFENDISIISRNGELGNRVTLADEGNGITRAEVRAKIKKIGS